MTRLFSWLIMIPLAVAVVAFTVANRGAITLDLWPMPVAVDVPVFALALVGGFAGFLVGAVIAWLSGGRRRAVNRNLVRQLEAAKRQETTLQKRIDQLEQAQSAPQTALLSAPPTPPGTRADAA